MTPLKKISKKLKLSEAQIASIIVEHHSLEYLYPQKQLEHVELNINHESWKRLTAIAKALKVSVSAVVASVLRRQLERESEDV